MSEDMTVRGFTPCTQRGYNRALRVFTAFLGRSADHAGAENLRRYQLELGSSAASATGMMRLPAKLIRTGAVCRTL